MVVGVAAAAWVLLPPSTLTTEYVTAAYGFGSALAVMAKYDVAMIARIKNCILRRAQNVKKISRNNQ